MATSTLKRPQSTGTWSNIFPNETVTEQQSALFVKKLLAIAVSNLTYLRAIFPEVAFGDRCLEDLSLKILRDDCTCPGACQVIQWVKGCFDALDKKYLKTLIIGIYVNPDDPETLIESYTFKFNYNNTTGTGVDVFRNEKKLVSAVNAAETKKATIRLLRTIIVLTQSLKSLPDNVMMTMKLLYYDEVTPVDYEPPGFKPADNDTFRFEDDPMNIRVGDVQTPFHTVKLRIKTDRKQFELQEEEPIAEEENTQISEGLDMETESRMEVSPEKTCVNRAEALSTQDEEKCLNELKQPQQCDDVPLEEPVKPGTDDQAVSQPMSQETHSDVNNDDYGVRCPCGCNEDDGLMILCALCKFWQHAICFSITNEADAPSTHICERCANVSDPSKLPTDAHLSGLKEIALQATCLWRRTLHACSDLPHVMPNTLANRLGVEITVAQGLINRLEKEGFLKLNSRTKRTKKEINKEKIVNVGFSKYLNRKLLTPESINKNLESANQVIQNDSTEPVTSITEKTEKISLAGCKKADTAAKSSEHPEKVIFQVRKSPRLQTKKLQRDEKRGKKRAVSKDDRSQTFEISDSQDFDQRPIKRRKSSQVAHPIMV